jgi:hypothetical protein
MSASLILRPAGLYWSRFEDQPVERTINYVAECDSDYDLSVETGYGERAASSSALIGSDVVGMKITVRVVCDDSVLQRSVVWLDSEDGFQLIFTVEMPEREFEQLSRIYGDPEYLYRLDLTVEGDSVHSHAPDGSSVVYRFGKQHWSEDVNITGWRLSVGNVLTEQRQT